MISHLFASFGSVDRRHQRHHRDHWHPDYGPDPAAEQADAADCNPIVAFSQPTPALPSHENSKSTPTASAPYEPASYAVTCVDENARKCGITVAIG